MLPRAFKRGRARSSRIAVDPDRDVSLDAPPGASPIRSILRVVLPLLSPAIIAAAIIVFVDAIDDFVIAAWLSWVLYQFILGGCVA